MNIKTRMWISGIMSMACAGLGGGLIGHAIGYDDGFTAAKTEDHRVYELARASMRKLGLCEWGRQFSQNCGIPYESKPSP